MLAVCVAIFHVLSVNCYMSLAICFLSLFVVCLVIFFSLCSRMNLCCVANLSITIEDSFCILSGIGTFLDPSCYLSQDSLHLMTNV